MIDLTITCPECSAVIVTSDPEIMICDRCPACKSHIWDAYDLMMAEVSQSSLICREHAPIAEVHTN